MNRPYEINSFKKGITLSKNYIIGRMQGNQAYGLYTPNNCICRKGFISGTLCNK